ncbi:hypothetical protein [Gordonia crocea]|uniref:Uncharacterized protein n=1 Tax=Gordonia crocea TaxID=589162 RepID=A0A7M3SVD6_9ACTN|nr:hypothetical protein [Gordonia crocea]GED96610.1 hypothetical protein nbrc107697_06490 [Gordonia crocea]
MPPSIVWDSHYEFLTLDPSGPPIEQIHREALDNLAAAPAQWELFSPTMATGSGFDFSAEKLLSADFIAQG